MALLLARVLRLVPGAEEARPESAHRLAQRRSPHSRRPCACSIPPCRSSPRSCGSASDRPRRPPAFDRARPVPAVPRGTDRSRGRAGNRHPPGDRHPGAHPAHGGEARSQAAARGRALLPHRVARHRPAPRRRHPEARQREARVQGRGRAQGRRHALHRRSSTWCSTSPRSQEDPQRKRRKEREQLEKNIANSKRQLADEAFLAKAPRQGGREHSRRSWPTTKRSSRQDRSTAL